VNHLQRSRMVRLFVFAAILVVASALVLFALRQKISLFYTPAQLVLDDAPLHRAIRLGGMVVPGSIVRDLKTMEVRFKVTDNHAVVDVSYRGLLPDLFREGKGVVAQGEKTDHTHFVATEILAKHDENYMPPEVKAALSSPQLTQEIHT